MEESERLKIEFTWVKKRGIGGKKKDVHFYESFTYDGDQYTIYDSVYLYKDEETEPYVGKIVKIWENADKSKKVKILWFFRPCEIQNFIGPNDASENELFLASGEGQGLANVNPLEAIAGKCNVICTSKDIRNLQPSGEDIQMADFVFYRTFDVGQRIISDEIVEKIAGIEVKYLFNKVGSERAVGVSEVRIDKKQVYADVIAHNKPVPALNQNEKESSIEKINRNSVDTLINENDDFNPLSIERSSAKERNSNSDVDVKEMAQSMGSFVERDPFSGQGSAYKIGVDSKRLVKSDSKGVIIKKKPFDGQESASQVGVASRRLVGSDGKKETFIERSKCGLEVDCRDFKVDVYNKQEEEDCFVEGVVCVSEEKSSKMRKGDVSSEPFFKNDHSMQKSRSLCNRGDLKTSNGFSIKNNDGMEKSKSFHGRDHVKSSTQSFKPYTKDGLKRRLAKNLDEIEIRSKKIRLETNATNAALEASKEPPTRTQNVDHGVDFRLSEISRRPSVDRSKWFIKGVPWEERIRDALEQGRVVLVQNLSPSLTSAQVEEIIWDGFKERCSTNMMQQTAFSSPYSGKAYVILKSRDAAENMVRKLHLGCLMSTGRPLVGNIGNPCLPEKKQTYPGHFGIDQIRLLKRETKDAVSTSHPAQPNTIEFDMAMEWCLLQERGKRALTKLYQKQEEEMRRLRAKLRST